MSSDPPKILCQPDGEKSCGACCGMYNHVEPDEESTRRRLFRRTLAFHRQADIEDAESLREFRHRHEDGADVKPLDALPSCPFLGFIDVEPGDEEPDAQVVGCLAHPMQNDGVDGRDCGVYDRFICDEYLCAAHDVLRRDEVQLVLDAVDDSYLYGLLITNPKYVRHLLKLVSRRVGARPNSTNLQEPTVIEAAARCFEFLRAWPHRGEDGIFGQVRVDSDLNMMRRPLPADRHDIDAEPVDALLACLGTECEDIDELRRARHRVQQAVVGFAEAVRRVRP